MSSIYGTDALLSSLSVKSEKRDRRDKSDHDRKKSYFEKPAEVCVACSTSVLLCEFIFRNMFCPGLLTATNIS